ncbi:ATP-dependent DNA helicase Q5 like protein [Verticillium longisporum]|uniref:DNA 3'-5' helicase n=1 Tax=Verticillium longisporum TaxID=100787 RepID=A0A8I2Z530_VERLO|nr:ATP-dependent DNA helicase Q5 like protein [Verticillium longisporum]
MAPLSRSNSCVDIDFTLRRQFKKKSFRPQQREIITAALDGNDVFVQAATSFGKSLCFQLPACIDQGITIVVSPLLSLMMNQVEQLQAAGIKASSYNSNTRPEEKDRINRDLASGHPRTRLLYVTPELCSSESFRNRLKLVHQQCELARIAIDEAHCISEWVRDDILLTLGLSATPERLKSFVMSAHRPNLHLEIRYTQDREDGRLSNFIKWIRSVHDRRKAEPRKSELEALGERLDNVSGIIYTISRDECESLANALSQEGIGARPFHAKLTKEVKESTLARWVTNEPGYDIIVATTAFGMGIDKDNVRFVVHWRLPKSFEGYYQEAGRAGRDGNASYCFLYYSREDLQRVQNMVSRGSRDGSNSDAQLRSLQRLALYCENTSLCRHAEICSYFGETAIPPCDYACDWHKDAQDLKRRLARGLASEEWVSTQAQHGEYDGDPYYDD